MGEQWIGQDEPDVFLPWCSWPPKGEQRDGSGESQRSTRRAVPDNESGNRSELVGLSSTDVREWASQWWSRRWLDRWRGDRRRWPV